MHDEDDFLRKLLENPADNTTRLVYADWLDECGDEQSETTSLFLPLTARLPADAGNAELAAELQQLATELNKEWLAVVSRLKVENCPVAKAKDNSDEALARLGIRFKTVCDKRWDELTATDDDAVRFCEGCKQPVHYCDTIQEARKQAWQGHCVAVNLGVIRREGDLERPGLTVGALI